MTTATKLQSGTNTTTQAATVVTDSSGLWGHPKGLTTLFFTELWERFSYYGMRALLVLYMVAAISDGGLGFSTQTAAFVYGMYTMSVYLLCIPGGLIADRVLGGKLSVLIGGLIIAAGHFSMACASLPTFWAGLLLIIFGTGLLKPNISTMLGSLYGKDDPRRDGGFSIFYMGINIGAALSPLVCGFLAQSNEFKGFLKGIGIEPTSSWHFGFAAAGVGMVVGLMHYLAQHKRLKHVGNKPERKTEEKEEPPKPLSRREKKRLAALGVLFFFTILFWSVYEQAGTSLNLFADKMTNNNFFGWHFPSSWYQSLPAVYCIIFAPLFTVLWDRLGKKQPSSPAKFTYGMLFLGLGIFLMVPAALLSSHELVSPLWLVMVYLLEVIGELCLSPVGLSTVTKLAPVRFLGLTMGVWFVSSALGNLLAGYLGGFFDQNDTSKLVILFGFMTAYSLLSAVVLGLLVPRVRKLMAGVH